MDCSVTGGARGILTKYAGYWRSGSVGVNMEVPKPGQPQLVLRTDTWLVGLILLTVFMNAVACLTVFLSASIPYPEFFILFLETAAVLWMELRLNISKRRRLKKMSLTGNLSDVGTNRMGSAVACPLRQAGFCNTQTVTLKSIKLVSPSPESK